MRQSSVKDKPVCIYAIDDGSSLFVFLMNSAGFLNVHHLSQSIFAGICLGWSLTSLHHTCIFLAPLCISMYILYWTFWYASLFFRAILEKFSSLPSCSNSVTELITARKSVFHADCYAHTALNNWTYRFDMTEWTRNFDIIEVNFLNITKNEVFDDKYTDISNLNDK